MRMPTRVDLRRRSTWIAGFVMVAPAVVLFTAVKAVPVFLGGYLGMTDWDGFSPDPDFVGLQNYARLFEDDAVLRATFVTVVLALTGTVALNILGLAFALILKERSRSNSFFRSVLFYPVVLSPLILGFLWSAILGTNGVINSTRPIDDPIPFLSDPNWALASIIFVTVWAHFGFNMVLYVAGLQSVPFELVEAARIDGASRWQANRWVVIPMIAPIVTVVIVLNLVGLLRTYDLVLSLTDGGPAGRTRTFNYLILAQSFRDSELGYGSAQAMTLMVASGALAIWITYARNKRHQEVQA